VSEKLGSFTHIVVAAIPYRCILC